MPSFAELAEQHHAATTQLAELRTIESREAELQALQDTIGNVASTLNDVAGEVGDAAGDIDAQVRQLEGALDQLGDAHEQLARELRGLSEAAGEVSDGLEQFSETAEEVAGQLDSLHQQMDAIRRLIDLGDASPGEILRGFHDYFSTFAEKLGPWIERIPGLGAFITIWLKAIEAISGSAMELEAETLRRNRLHREAFGDDAFDLYIQIGSPRQQRQAEIKRLEQTIAGLEDQMAGHPGRPNQPRPSTDAYHEDRTDVQAAYDRCLRQAGLDRYEWERMKVRKDAARLRAKKLRTQSKELGAQLPTLPAVDASEHEIRSVQTRKDAVDRALDKAQREIDAADAAMQPIIDCVKQTLGAHADVNPYFLQEHHPELVVGAARIPASAAASSSRMPRGALIAVAAVLIGAAVATPVLLSNGDDTASTSPIGSPTVSDTGAAPVDGEAEPLSVCEAAREQEHDLVLSSPAADSELVPESNYGRAELGFPSPPFEWSGVPDAATELALFVKGVTGDRQEALRTDPEPWRPRDLATDEPAGAARLADTIWLVTGIDRDATSLPAMTHDEALDAGLTLHPNGVSSELDGEAVTGFYRAMGTPRATYHFTLFALCEPEGEPNSQNDASWFVTQSVAYTWFTATGTG